MSEWLQLGIDEQAKEVHLATADAGDVALEIEKGATVLRRLIDNNARSAGATLVETLDEADQLQRGLSAALDEFATRVAQTRVLNEAFRTELRQHAG